MAETFAGASIPGSAYGQATLADKYDLAQSRVLMSGTQAIARLLLM